MGRFNIYLPNIGTQKCIWYSQRFYRRAPKSLHPVNLWHFATLVIDAEQKSQKNNEVWTDFYCPANRYFILLIGVTWQCQWDVDRSAMEGLWTEFPIQFRKTFSQVTSSLVNGKDSENSHFLHCWCGLHQRSVRSQFNPELKFFDHHLTVFWVGDNKLLLVSEDTSLINQACSGQQRCISSRMNGTRSKRRPGLTSELTLHF